MAHLSFRYFKIQILWEQGEATLTSSQTIPLFVFFVSVKLASGEWESGMLPSRSSSPKMPLLPLKINNLYY